MIGRFAQIMLLLPALSGTSASAAVDTPEVSKAAIPCVYRWDSAEVPGALPSLKDNAWKNGIGLVNKDGRGSTDFLWYRCDLPLTTTASWALDLSVRTFFIAWVEGQELFHY